MSTSGGVRGGNREEPSYSILPLEQDLSVGPRLRGDDATAGFGALCHPFAGFSCRI